MGELKVNRTGINVADDSSDHMRTISYNDDDSLSKIISKQLVDKGYFPNVDNILWKIYMIREIEDKKDVLTPPLKIGYAINLKGKWRVATTFNPSKVSDFINYCKTNNSSLKEIYFSCDWLFDVI